MRKIYQSVFFILILSILSGCASMDQSECNHADWLSQGLTDGQSGQPENTYSLYADDCAEFGVSVSVPEYKKGWQQGIAQYCTRDNGWSVGISGGYYQNACPKSLEAEFYSAYQSAHNIHIKQQKIATLGYEIESLGDKLAKSGLSTSERDKLSEERNRKKKEKRNLNFELGLAKDDARRMGFPVGY
ncbi:DUF2799 domain-containing protein [Shewanella submarina]|uniref:DUF2799 domain-containing protein n=1 Tax=Shewanella submarina TaxID=2016376 RepID=A0ABV7GN11_9GAMM|nr:DUF2799 domain-containing protein [Shewanella submarina]MCL1036189.1 DUF2799 domain-containing protein [Shewanella submarina]